MKFQENILVKGARYGAAWGFGAAKGYNSRKGNLRLAHSLDGVAGAAAMLVSMFFHASGSGKSFAGDVLEAVGDAGIGSYINSRGALQGATRSKFLPGGKLPQIVGGQNGFMSPSEIAMWASRR